MMGVVAFIVAAVVEAKNLIRSQDEQEERLSSGV